MTSSTLTSVATRAVGQYAQVGKLLADGYRNGTRRLARGANSRYAAFLDKREMPLVNQSVKASLLDIEKGVVAILEDGVVRGTDRAEQVLGKVTDGVTRGIQRVAETANRFETAFETNAISRVGRFSMPIANATLAVANLALQGTKRLNARVTEVQAEVVATTPRTTRAAKKVVNRSKKR